MANDPSKLVISNEQNLSDVLFTPTGLKWPQNVPSGSKGLNACQTFPTRTIAVEMAALIAEKAADGNLKFCRVAGKGDFAGAAGAVYYEPGVVLCKDYSCCCSWLYFFKSGSLHETNNLRLSTEIP